MSRRRRRSGSGSGSGSANAAGQQGQQHRHQSGKKPQAKPTGAAAVEAFWGPAPGSNDADAEAEAEGLQVERIRPTLDPGALPRSLGDPPLTPDTAAAHHVAVVYEEAVRAATALAAANGLLEDETAV
jgi:hypothetical protein